MPVDFTPELSVAEIHPSAKSDLFRVRDFFASYGYDYDTASPSIKTAAIIDRAKIILGAVSIFGSKTSWSRSSHNIPYFRVEQVRASIPHLRLDMFNQLVEWAETYAMACGAGELTVMSQGSQPDLTEVLQKRDYMIIEGVGGVLDLQMDGTQRQINNGYDPDRLAQAIED